MLLPIIGLTMGDPAGVGPELCLAAAAHSKVRKICRPVIYGDSFCIEKAGKSSGNFPGFAAIPSVGQHQSKSINVISSGGPLASQNIDAVSAGTVNAMTGQLSFDAVERAIDDAIAGTIAAVVTAPIHKEAWNAASIKHPGHTELFAERAGSDRFCMMMTSPTLSCSLVTCHVGYHEVPAMLTTERILEVITLSHEALQRMRGRKPNLMVLGLNPHAGENGLFGNQEEQTIIQPAIDAAREQGINVEGPVPPDTAFLASKLPNIDGHICMYHDQGLIPFKALAFDTGVNTTLGLPIVRTSVDHGTALDIAWQGKADVSSLIAAIELAVQLAEK